MRGTNLTLLVRSKVTDDGKRRAEGGPSLGPGTSLIAGSILANNTIGPGVVVS
jgi:hypothetical protein